MCPMLTERVTRCLSKIVPPLDARGDKQILEKPIPQISENGKVRVIVKKIRNLQICEIVETKMAKSVLWSKKLANL